MAIRRKKYNNPTYSQKMLKKYGKNLNLRAFTMDELEKLAKDVQRETGRRYDIAMRRPALRTTKAFKDLEKTGGKLSLSHWETKLGISRRKYLTREINRGLNYLNAQTSSYTGYKAWFNAQLKGATDAYKKAGGSDEAAFKALISDPDRAAKFWELVRRYEEENAAIYYRRGSPDVIDGGWEVWKRLQGHNMDDMVQILDDLLMDKDAYGKADLDQIIKDRMSEGLTF